MQIKQWIKENQDLIALGAFATVCAAATVSIVVLTKNTMNTQNRIVARVPAKNPLPGKFQGHDYAGLLSIGEKGDLWAHPDQAKPFRAGQIDKVNGRMFFGEYSYDGLPPQDVIDSAMAKVTGPNDVISLEAPPAVEA